MAICKVLATWDHFCTRNIALLECIPSSQLNEDTIFPKEKGTEDILAIIENLKCFHEIKGLFHVQGIYLSMLCISC